MQVWQQAVEHRQVSEAVPDMKAVSGNQTADLQQDCQTSCQAAGVAAAGKTGSEVLPFGCECGGPHCAAYGLLCCDFR